MCGTNEENYPADNNVAFFRCAPDSYVHSIDFASFGTPTGSCGNFKKGTCDATTTMEIVKKMCLGKSFCNVPVSISTFGDPCPNVEKSLFIQATCA